MIRAVIDTNVLVSAFSTHNPDSPTIRIYYAILRGDVGAALVTGNKRHFPNANFILTPSEFVALHASVL